MEKLIDCYCGIANNRNIPGSQSDNDIALAIGKLCSENPHIVSDLKSILTPEKCIEGMKEYIKKIDSGELMTLASEIGDFGNKYINELKSKFDADAANWVWNQETAEEKIREVILDYRIIAMSNRVIPNNLSFKETIANWIDQCSNIRVSYQAIKNDFDGTLGYFLGLLCDINRA